MLVTLALGSNLGDSQATLAAARRLIGGRVGPVVYESELLTTKAWGLEDQPDFLNQVIVVKHDSGAGVRQSENLNSIRTGAREDSLKTRLLRLLDLTQAIEAELGRERKTHWGPRTCDIDIIFAGNIRFETERLSLPHPWWKERDFVRDLLPRHLYLGSVIGATGK